MNQPLLAQEIFAQPLPDFFPQRLRRACVGKRIQYRLTSAVRERMQVPENITVAEWSEKYRHVTAIDAHPGRWRNDLLPHAVRPMEVISRHHVQQLWLCWPERAGKTNVILNATMCQVDRGVDSGNVFWLMPTENEAKKALGERIIPALKATPRTARLLSNYADDTTRTLVRFRHGPRLFPAWANSAATVSSFFGRLNIADEIDKFDTSGVGKETDILTLFFKRGRDRSDSKFLFASTPAGAYIYKRTMACRQVWEWRNRCPHCGDHITMDAEHFVIPDGATAEDIAHGLHPITYACNSCGAEWSESDRRQAYFDGDWFCTKGADDKAPETIGFHLTAYPLPNIPFREIAEKIVMARTGSRTDKVALANGYDVKDHEEELSTRKEDTIFALRDDRPRGLVPSDTDILLAGIDTQQRGFYYELRAFKYGFETASAQVREGFAENFDELVKALWIDEHTDIDGKAYPVAAAFIDSGGTTGDFGVSRTHEVYEFCFRNRHRKIYPIKGFAADPNNPRTEKLIRKEQEYYPGTKRKIPGFLVRYNIHVNYYKQWLSDKLNKTRDDPGAWVMHSEISDRYARQMVAEYSDDRGFWNCPRGKENHFWDCSVYLLALADMMQLKRKTKAVPGQQPASRRILSKGVTNG